MKIDQEKCVVCHAPIPYSEQPNAVYHAFLRARICRHPRCRHIVDCAEKDRTNSKRGRKRTRPEMLAFIERSVCEE